MKQNPLLVFDGELSTLSRDELIRLRARLSAWERQYNISCGHRLGLIDEEMARRAA